MFAAVCVFNVSTRMCTIKNKMAEGFLETKILEMLTQTREPSSSYLRAARALLRTQVLYRRNIAIVLKPAGRPETGSADPLPFTIKGKGSATPD